eukprot:gene47543-biopygen37508
MDEKDEKKSKQGEVDAKKKSLKLLKKSNKISGVPRRIVKQQSTMNKDLAMIENSLPSVLSSQSLQQRIVNEVKHHHRWLGVVFFYSDHFPRVLRVVSLTTNIIIMLFIQSITYTLTNPDDGSCEALTTRATCIAPRSPFATGESKRSAVRNNTLSSLFAAQAELRALSSEVVNYRLGLSEVQRVEFDAVWGLDTEGRFLLSQGGEEDVDTTTMRFRWKMFRAQVESQPDVKQLVLDDLTRVLSHISSVTKQIETATLSSKEIGKKLLFLFQSDLLPGISGQILHSKSHRDSLTASRVSLSYKIFGWVCIGLLNAGMLFYIMLFALNESDQRQSAWFQSFILWLVVEILLVSTGMAI